MRPPIAEPASEPVGKAEAGAAEAGAPRRVLIVDDNPDAPQGMAMLLKRAGRRVETAADGPSAIDSARAFRPDAIILGVGLPGMDGFDVAVRLRRDESCGNALIIGTSGYAGDEDRRRARGAAFDHRLVKSVDHEALAALIAGRESGRDADASRI